MVDFDALKKIITDKGYTISSLERKARIANGTIGKWESQTTHSPRLGTLLKIANILDCTVDDLIVRKPRY